MEYVLLALTGYLIGSIPSGYLAMRLFTGQDIRKIGTGNATVTAVLMRGGKRPGIAALLMEICKSAICILVARAMVGEPAAVLVILVAAVFGCSWSMWLKGAGGQGLTIGVTGLALVNVLAVAIMAAFYLIPYVLTKRYVLSTRLFRISIPVVLGLWYGVAPDLSYGVVPGASYSAWQGFLAGLLIIAPSFIKERAVGDDVLAARKADGAGGKDA
jgi:glycerol-3-phosphate acyltransferase PlsY